MKKLVFFGVLLTTFLLVCSAHAGDFREELKVPTWNDLKRSSMYFCPLEKKGEYIFVTLFPDSGLAVAESKAGYGYENSAHPLVNLTSCLDRVLHENGYRVVSVAMANREFNIHHAGMPWIEVIAVIRKAGK